MPFPTGDETELTDAELLQQFLKGLYELLRDSLADGRDPKGALLFITELLPSLRDGFGDMDRHFSRLDEAIPRISSEKADDHALEGGQLRMKLRIVRFFADRFSAMGGTGLFRRLLDSLEGLLDSVIDAAGAGGAIKEFKDFVRNSTAD